MQTRKTSIANYSGIYHNSCQQLELFPLPQKHQKPQIVSIPGTSVRECDRYQVTLEGQILGDRLSSDQALRLAKGLRKRKKLTELLDLIESCGITSEEAQIFLLSEIGAMDKAPISLRNS